MAAYLGTHLPRLWRRWRATRMMAFRGASAWHWSRRCQPPERGFRPAVEQLEVRAVPAAGALDPSFGSGGLQLFGGPSTGANALAVDGSGRIVVAGEIDSASSSVGAAARLNADGTLDPTFGGGGLPHVLSGASALALDGQGRIVVAGVTVTSTGEDFGVARLNADGTLDTSFGTGGQTHFNFNLGGTNIDGAQALALDGQGRIVVAGVAATSNGSNGQDFAVARLNANGSLDPSFGSGGLLHFNFGLGGGDFDGAQALALDGQGRLVLGGFASTPGGLAFAAARLNPSGALDTSFGTGGLTHFNFNLGGTSGDHAYALALDGQGRIVLGGSASTPGGSDFALARLNSSGALDANFGSGGLTHFNFDLGGSNADSARALTLDGQGRIVVAGSAPTNSGRDFAVARLSAGGTLDPSFGSGGLQHFNFGPGGTSRDDAQALAVDTQGRILLAGMAFTGSVVDFALARLEGDASVQTSPPPPPPAITAALVRMHRHGKSYLEVVVRFAATGVILEEFRCPFQSPQYTHISLSTLDANADSIPDAIVLTAHKGKRSFTETFA